MQPESQFYLNLIVVTFAAIFFILSLVFYLGAKKKKNQIQNSPLESDPSASTPLESASSAATSLGSSSLASAPQVTVSNVLSSQETEDLSKKSLKQALAQTEKMIFGRIKNLFASQNELQNFDDLEEILYTSDLGPQTVDRLLNKVKENLSRSEKKNLETIKQALKEEFQNILHKSQTNLDLEKKESLFALDSLKWNSKGVTVWMVVGVNGAGKTTSIGKLAYMAAGQGKKVMVAAGDTFRAAAGAQLKVWSDRAQVEIYSSENTKDPGAVAYEALTKCKNQNFDLLIVDTAGRLHTQVPLMEELKKVKRVLAKVDEFTPDETLIVLDANSGQNALMQAKEFHKSVGLTGVIVTKMDGTAKGGVVIGVANELGLPIQLVGVGEKISDLRTFSSDEFIDSILNG